MMNPPTLRRKPCQLARALLLLALASGCQSGYVLRQGIGQLQLAWGAAKITNEESALMESLHLHPDHLDKLLLIGKIRAFAEDELGLQAGEAYTTYYEIDRDAVSYIVTAAHPLAMVHYRWSFPFVGQVTYKGFFDHEDAVAEQRRLAEAGWDTSLAEVAAYSTLGWFQDPVLSTMLDYATGDLVDLILHELTHRSVYFRDRTALNESLATVIARVGAQRFLKEVYGEDSEQLAAYVAGIEARDLTAEVYYRLRSDLDALYRSSLPDVLKLQRKKELFSGASQVLSVLAAGPTSAPIDIPPSNAFLLSTGQYQKYVPLFEEMLDDVGGNPRRLMAFLKSLTDLDDPLPELHAALAPRDGGDLERFAR